jgi:hypothetical protein
MIPAGTPLGTTTVSLVGSPVAGLVDSSGRLIHLGKLDGWWDTPPSSGTSTKKVNEHGVFLSPGYYGARIINWQTRIDGFSAEDSMSVARKLLAAVTVNSLTDLRVTDENGLLTAEVRQEGDPVLVRQGNRVIVDLSLIAPDSRRYGPWQNVSTGLPVVSGGFSLPVTLPLTMTGGNTSGSLALTNEGDMSAPAIFTVNGPCPPFSVSNQAGEQLNFMESVPAGRILYVDGYARTALLDGVANRVVTGTWPSLRPGVNTFQFSASAYDAGALLTISYRSAWR